MNAEDLDRERRTMAELLAARAQVKAAALVAMSEYQSDCVDAWDGGQYEVRLSLPPAVFDLVDDELHAQLSAAAADVIAPDHFAGLVLAVRLADAEPGWDATFMEWLRSGAQAGAGTSSPRGTTGSALLAS